MLSVGIERLLWLVHEDAFLFYIIVKTDAVCGVIIKFAVTGESVL